MKIDNLSPKQLQIYRFAMQDDCHDLICHGSIRSGKTMCMSTAFVMWAMDNFDRTNFGICGKTVKSAIRNIIEPLLKITSWNKYYKLSFNRSDNLLIVKSNKKTNYFYVFGGKDEQSQDLIQGITLSGLLLDEVALMPESFVNQAIARTVSEKHAKRFYNCNPENPNHFFYQDFILKAKERNIMVLHFQLEDNPLFDDKQIESIKNMYTGAFYDRYILGRWVKAEGLVFPDYERCLYDPDDEHIQQVLNRNQGTEWFIGCDYGTLNPFVYLKVCVDHREQIAYFDCEWYFNGREHSVQKTDSDYRNDLEEFTSNDDISDVVVDPSASSFITELRNRSGFHVTPAKNDVLDGIRMTQRLMYDGKIKISKRCKNLIRELGLYSWDDRKAKDTVIKEDDHSPDAMRYIVYTTLKRMNW